MPSGPPPGSLVAWWDGPHLELAVAAGEEKQRVRIVLAGGREDRIPASRIAFIVESHGPVPGKTEDERRAAGARVAEALARVRARAAEVDVATAWELALETSGPVEEAALADLALGSSSGEARAAIVQAVLADGIRFVRKGGGWEPRGRDAVQDLLRQRDRVAERTADRVALTEGLAAAVRTGRFVPTGTHEERRYLEALEELAIRDLEASGPSRILAVEALEGSGLRYERPGEGAFRLLRLTGKFDSDDANLEILRRGLRTAFPAEVEREAAEAASRDFDRFGRSDRTALPVLTIDSPHTREVDDGLSLEILDGERVRVGVHIADPQAFVPAGGVVDAEALMRSTTYYFPERRLPMLPEAISEGAASLEAGRERPALSFFASIGPDGVPVDPSIERSVIRVHRRLDYDETDRAIAERSGPWLGVLEGLLRAATALEGRRVAVGAVAIRAPEVDVRVLDGGEIVLDRIDTGSPAHRIVSECMVLAGSLAAAFCLERGLPAIYRRQPAPDSSPRAPEGGAHPIVAARSARRGLRRGEAGVQPGPHYALGVKAYAQVTSPLRRYQDLAVHRQIAAALDSKSIPHDLDAMQRIAATTERAEIDGRRAERSVERYWLLRYLQQRGPELLEAVVVEPGPRPVVVLLETLLEETVPSLAGTEAGTIVRLRVERVNPRADILLLRPAS